MLERVPTTVFWNPTAGSAARNEAIRERLEAFPGVTVRTPPDAESASDAVAALADADVCRDSTQFVVAAGGDGTVTAVVEGLMRCERRPLLGVLPLGSGNDLARSLRIPLAPEKALDVLRTGVRRPLDVMHVTSTAGDRRGANMVTGGNTGRCLERITDELKQQWGPLCYLRGAVDLVPDLEVYEITVVCDGGAPETFTALNVFAANGRTSGGGLEVSPGAKLDDGLVDLVIIRDGTPLEIAGLATRYLVSDYTEHELVSFRRARRVEIASDPPLPLTLDGNTIGTTPLVIEVERHALEVLAPVT